MNWQINKDWKSFVQMKMTKVFVDHKPTGKTRCFAMFHDHLTLTLMLQDVLRNISQLYGRIWRLARDVTWLQFLQDALKIPHSNNVDKNFDVNLKRTISPRDAYLHCLRRSCPLTGRHLPFQKKYNSYHEIFFKVIFSSESENQNVKLQLFLWGASPPRPPSPNYLYLGKVLRLIFHRMHKSFHSW